MLTNKIKPYLLASLAITISILVVSCSFQESPLDIESKKREDSIKQLLDTKKCQQCNLEYAKLDGANLSGADLGGANLYQASMKGINLSNANLSGANLTLANLEGANLDYADLAAADLSGANLSFAILTYTKMRGTKFNDYTKLENAQLPPGFKLEKRNEAQ